MIGSPVWWRAFLACEAIALAFLNPWYLSWVLRRQSLLSQGLGALRQTVPPSPRLDALARRISPWCLVGGTLAALGIATVLASQAPTPQTPGRAAQGQMRSK